MCGRYRLARKKEILAETFDVENDVEWSPRYNVAPGQNVPVVRQDAAQPLRSISLARWGLIPSLVEGRQSRIQNDQRQSGNNSRFARIP